MLLPSQDSETIRALFPALASYLFMNSAGLTPLPSPSRDAMTRMISDFSDHAYMKAAAGLVGCSPEELAFVKNTSDGISIVASGLRLAPGDEVIINDVEFPSNVYPWLNLQRKGVVVRMAESAAGRITADAIAAQASPRTKIIAISSVQYASGYRADLAALGQLARDKGALLLVDAIQSLGVIPMDVKKLGIHFLSCGGFKWLCGPVGTGIFFLDREKLNDLDITVAGWNTVANPTQYHVIDYTPKNNAQRFEEGSGNYIGVCGLGESMRLLSSVGIGRIEGHVLALTDYLEGKLRSKGVEILSPRGAGEKSGIFVFKPPAGETPEALWKRLEERNILTAPRGGGLRVSPHFFNTTGDIDGLLEAL